MSLLGRCHPLAVIARSRNRPTWHMQKEAGRRDGKASFLSEGINKLVINQVQTQKGALMIEVTGKPVAVDTSEVTGKPVSVDKRSRTTEVS